MSLQVKNWEGFQHYKDRSPIWIKLHKRILDDFDFQRLPVASRALAPMIWLLASEYERGIITASVTEIAFRLRQSEQEITAALKPLIDKGFLIELQDASATLAEPERDSIPEKRREETYTAETEERPVLIHNRPDSASDVASFVMQGLGLAGRENRWTVEDAIKRSMESFDVPAMGAASQIVTAWQEYERADVESRSGPGGFLKDGKFLSKTRWRLRGGNGEQKQGKLEQLRALRKANGQNGGELAVLDGGSTTGESKGGRVPETL
jgi:hypothetical protein